MALPPINGNDDANKAAREAAERAAAESTGGPQQAGPPEGDKTKKPSKKPPTTPPETNPAPVEREDWQGLADPKKPDSSHSVVSVRNAVPSPEERARMIEQLTQQPQAQDKRPPPKGGKVPERPRGIEDPASTAASGANQPPKGPGDRRPEIEKAGERLPVSAAEKKGIARTLGRAALWPFRQIGYVAKTFAGEIKRPTKREFLEGVIAKGVPFSLSAGTWGTMLLPAHPIAFALAMALSVSQETLHGIFVRSWMNFQNKLGKEKGVTYQSIVNLLYFQAGGFAFRTIAALSIPGTIPPWALKYWQDLGLTTLVGSFCGSLGTHGLNELYNKGVISEKSRDRIQQFGRDGFFLISGIFFGTGAMSFFWPLFLVQQSLDLALYFAGAIAKPRPGSEAEKEGAANKPVGKVVLEAVLNSPFVFPFYALFNLLTGRNKKDQGPQKDNEVK